MLECAGSQPYSESWPGLRFAAVLQPWFWFLSKRSFPKRKTYYLKMSKGLPGCSLDPPQLDFSWSIDQFGQCTSTNQGISGDPAIYIMKGCCYSSSHLLHRVLQGSRLVVKKENVGWGGFLSLSSSCSCGGRRILSAR